MRKIRKIKCPMCEKQIDIRCLRNHLKRKDHKELKDKLLEIEKNISNNCIACNSKIKSNTFLQSICIYFNLEFYKPKYCSKKCIVIWNKGLTKETNKNCKESSERMKINNPGKKAMLEIMNDPTKYKNWIDAKKNNTRMNLPYDERFGLEKSKEIKENMSNLVKERYKNGWSPRKGKKHSEKTKEVIRQKTIEHINSGLTKTSKLQQSFFKTLTEQITNENFVSNYKLVYYLLDIAVPEKKICIEIDGDFWHCNEKEGFTPKFDCQKRNLKNDEKKKKYLEKEGWKLIRIWEADINKNIEECISRIKAIL